MWILASSQGTNFPFIQIFSDFGKLMLGSMVRKTAHSSNARPQVQQKCLSYRVFGRAADRPGLMLETNAGRTLDDPARTLVFHVGRGALGRRAAEVPLDHAQG